MRINTSAVIPLLRLNQRRILTPSLHLCPSSRNSRYFGAMAAETNGAGLGWTPAEDGKYDYDLFTIGIGSGGTRASRISASFGAKVAAVEFAYHPISSDMLGGIGGTCVLRGCVPKKILMYGSAFSADFEDARGFGWDVNEKATFDWNHLITKKTKEIERLNGIYRRMLDNAKVSLYEGLGRIVDPHTVEIVKSDGSVETHTTKYILIATGGRATLLDIPGKEFCITSDEALSLDKFPKRIVVIGGGGFDEEMRDLVAHNLKNRGIKLHANANPTKIERLAEDKYLVHTDDGAVIETDAVMMATGRHPNTSKLGLDKVGVEVDGSGAIKVNGYSQTNIPSIFAVGDVTNRINLTPVAIMEGHCFARTVFDNDPIQPSHENVPSAVFCQPPLAVVGLTEAEAVAQAKSDVVVFTSSFNPMKNTISGRVEKTLMKLLVDSGSDKVLGVSMCGPDSAEIMQGMAIALKAGATKKTFDSTVGLHPSAAEEFCTMRTPTRRIPPGDASKVKGSETA